MPGTELRSAVSITVEPTCPSTVRDCPAASMKVIFAIEQNYSLEYRVTAWSCANSVGERRLYRGRLHRASTAAPKGHSECIPRGTSFLGCERRPGDGLPPSPECGRFPREPRLMQPGAQPPRLLPPSFGRPQPKPTP